MSDTQRIRENVWISEIILENFMSYEYSRISLKPGLNLICGPNGAGKSTILLAISVALGQISTERGRRLSDLIKRGKDIARVTLVFDNHKNNGSRPISFSDSDTFMLSRYLRKDGSYWYEADYKEITLWEVSRMFQGFGINPNNMLIIMHQNTMEQFGLTGSEEKLKLLEEAVGFGSYREKLLDAKSRLESTISEDESLSELLGRAKESLGYWKSMHDKYLLRNELVKQKKLLKREAIWVRVIKNEKALSSLNDRLRAKQNALKSNQDESIKTGTKIKKLREELDGWKVGTRESFYSLLHLEKEETKFVGLEKHLKEKQEISEKLDKGQEKEKIKNELKAIHERKSRTKKDIDAIRKKLGELERKLDPSLEKYISHRVKYEIFRFRKGQLEDEVRKINEEVDKVNLKLVALTPLIKGAGEKIETERSQNEVENDLNLVDAKIKSLGDIPKETEEIYSNYSKLLEELKQKSRIVSENKKKGLEELNKRKKVWRDAVEGLLERVNPSFQQILSSIGANGLARMVNGEDVESAGLELWVGFRDSELVLLDSYTQSGGEKTASIMAFLLSIQEYLKSPFTAVDEFDLHMDPKNREEIYKLIISSIKEKGGECLVITPSQLTITDPSVHVIVVQKTYGRSEVREAR
ncbi:MAG TPA: AAA family ATPase [Thermoplasmata archaeon]|nr:AAA family ATPase [Thermoplasmata archaeon]